MLDYARNAGVRAALTKFALAEPHVPASWLQGVFSEVKHAPQTISQMGHDFVATPGRLYHDLQSPEWWKAKGHALKDSLIGNPGQYWHEFKNDQLFKPNSQLHQAVMPSGVLDAAFKWGFPAMSMLAAYQAAQRDPSRSGSSLGSAFGNVAGGVLGTPLGGLGMAAGSVLGGELGRTVGSVFDRKPDHDADRLYYPGG